MSSPYIALAASGDNSRNGAPGSSNVTTRSRGNSLPRARYGARALVPGRLLRSFFAARLEFFRDQRAALPPQISAELFLICNRRWM